MKYPAAGECDKVELCARQVSQHAAAVRPAVSVPAGKEILSKIKILGVMVDDDPKVIIENQENKEIQNKNDYVIVDYEKYGS